MRLVIWRPGCVSASLLLLTLLPLAAAGQEAFTRQVANVRAGPDRSYPLVSQLAAGAPVRVFGCLDDWTWCDVAFDDNRGWVYAPFLLYGVQDDRLPLYTYGPSLGIAIVGFTLGAYWDEHYRQRPWYSGRQQWEGRAPPEHRVPAGLPPHAVYVPGTHPEGAVRAGHAAPAGNGAARGGAPHPAAAAAPRAPARPEEPHRTSAAPAQHPAAAPAREAAAAPVREASHAPAPAAPREPAREATREPAHAPVREVQHVPERPREGGEEKTERENR